MTLISVIIPVYNGELTIEQTVNSVLNQTFSDFELIVINDGSVDSTLDVLSKFKDSRIKIFSYSNSGLSASRNRGIEHACGELISFLDADDLWTPDKLEAQLKALRENPDADVAYSETDFIDAEGNSLGYGIHHIANGYVFQNLLVYFFVGSGSNALIRKHVFNQVGQFDETLTSAEDWDMFLRLATKFQYIAVPESQVLYRITDKSMSRNVIRQEREMLKVVENAYSQEPGKSLLHLKRLTYANLYFYLAASALRGVPDRQGGLIATRFLWRSIKNDMGILKRVKSVSIIIFKIISVILLPAERARSIRNTMKSMMKRTL